MGKKPFLGDSSSSLDNLRCRRSDGRQWRCPQPAKPGLSFCEHHYHQMSRHQQSIKNGDIEAEASAESKRRLLLTADPPLTNKRRRKSLTQLIFPERMKKVEVETESSYLKMSMDLPSSDLLRHHHSDGPEWQCSPPALPSPPFCHPRNPRCKQRNEENTKVTEPRPMRRSRVVTNLLQRQKAEASAKEPARTAQRIHCEGDKETAEPARVRGLPIPDSLRCRRSDGRKWRCYQRAIPGLRFCEHHRMRCNRNYNQATMLKIIKPEKESHLTSDPQRFAKQRQPRRGMGGEQMEDGLTRMEQNEEAQEALNLATTGLSFCDNDLLRSKEDNTTIKAAKPGMLDMKAAKPAAPEVDAPEPMTPDLSVFCIDSLCRKEDTKEYKAGSADQKCTLHLSGNPKPSKKDFCLSDHLRCRRSDGRKWRCPQLAMPSVGFCEYHYLQMRRNQGRRQNTKLASAAKHKRGQPARKLRQGRVRGQLPGDGRTRTKQKMGEKLEDAYLEVTRDLPNGVMAISPGTAIGLANASPSVDRKLGSDYGFLLGRPFRSKNAERVPLATVQKLPFFRSMGGRRNRVCHCCRASENNIVARIRCFSCQELFCKTCIETWHSELSEFDVKNACPVCRGCCSCINCKSGRDTAGGFKVASSRDLSHSE